MPKQKRQQPKDVQDEYILNNALLLTVLLLQKEWTPLSQVIATGDYLNHAIFTAKELNCALSFLVTAGYVELNSKKEICVTEKALGLCDQTIEKAGVSRMWKLIYEKLKDPAIGNSRKIKIYFTETEIKSAYQQYVENLR